MGRTAPVGLSSFIAREVGQDRDPTAGRLPRPADLGDRGRVPVRVAVGEIEAGDVHNDLDHCPERVAPTRCRPDRADDAGSGPALVHARHS
jgi:hypothetical protein